MAAVAGHDQGPAHLSVELEVEFCGQRTMTDRNGSVADGHLFSVFGRSQPKPGALKK